MSSPQNGGPHIVYGLCPRIGARPDGLGGLPPPMGPLPGLASRGGRGQRTRAKRLAPALQHPSEGLSRFLKEIEGVKPDRATDRGTARIFYDVGEAWPRNLGKPWTGSRRTGEESPSTPRVSIASTTCATHC